MKHPGRLNELAMPEVRRVATPVQMAILVGVVVAGVMMSGLGVWLVYLARQGQETVSIFGQQFNTNTTGILAIFVGGVTIGAGAILRAMRSKP
jgi:hypothetical protein